MSVRNHSQSLQNEYGQLDLVVRDSGTANICSRVQTIRFEPEGSILNYGPNTRELTINVNAAGGGSGEPVTNVLWRVGTTGTDNIRAKYATPNPNATGDYAVAHGQSSTAGGANSYAGGNGVTTTGDNTEISGLTNTITGTSTNSSIVTGTENDISDARGASIIGGSDNEVASSHHNTLIVGCTTLTSTSANTVYTSFLEVGQTSTIGSIQRISLSSNNWADGNCGNDSFIYFTPNDFKLVESSRGNVIGTLPDASTCVTGTVTIGADNMVVTNQSSVNDSEHVAIKMIPKGFQVDNTLSVIYTQYTNPAPVDVPFPLFQVYYMDNTNGALAALTPATVPTGAVTTIAPNATATGNGRTSIVVCLEQTSGVLASTESLMSVAVGIKRV